VLACAPATEVDDAYVSDVVTQLAGDGAADDVALLVATIEPTAAADVGVWPATMDAPGRARRLLRDALADVESKEEVDDLVLAVSEAVANGVEHSGASTVSVEVRRGTSGRVAVVVRDDGRFAASPPSSGDRGRGVSIMRAVADVGIRSDDTGTEVVIVCELGPGAAMVG
jgi:anti-sigma regulatory factor (Ser/Thr protein kinase)